MIGMDSRNTEAVACYEQLKADGRRLDAYKFACVEWAHWFSVRAAHNILHETDAERLADDFLFAWDTRTREMRDAMPDYVWFGWCPVRKRLEGA